MAKTVVEEYTLYNGEVKLQFLPNSHTYKIDGDKKIGVTTITGIINKEALMLWPLEEAITFLNRKLLAKGQLDTQAALWSNGELTKLLEESKMAFRYKQTRGTDAGTFGHDWLEQYLRAYKNKAELPKLFEKVDLDRKFGTNPDKFDDEYIRATDLNNLHDAIMDFIRWMDNHDVEVIDVERIVYSREYDYCGKFDAILRIDGKIYLVDFKTSNPSREFADGIYPENYAQTGGYDIALTEEFPEFKIDGHAIFNISKKTGKLSINYSTDRQENRDFFLYTLGTKRGMQFHTRRLSVKYQEKASGKKAK